jgi:hypothetical protein
VYIAVGNGREYMAEQATHLMARKQKTKRTYLGSFEGMPPMTKGLLTMPYILEVASP